MLGPALFLDVEVGIGEVPKVPERVFAVDDGLTIHTFARAMLGGRPFGLFTLEGGPALNVYVTDGRQMDPTALSLGWVLGPEDGVRTVLAPGLSVFVGL